MNRKRNVIFLDIDGVLQPPGRQNRFQHDLEKLRERLAAQFDDAAYLEISEYDLGAAYYDWDERAVERLGRLCEDTSADVVISSDWRTKKSISLLKAYFRIHDLHHYVTDKTNESSKPPHYRAGEVKEYVDSHPEIGQFVIFDDQYRKEFDRLFPDQFVHTGSCIDEANDRRARQILSGGPATDANRPYRPSEPVNDIETAAVSIY